MKTFVLSNRLLGNVTVLVDDDVWEWAKEKEWRIDSWGRVVELQTKHKLARMILGVVGNSHVKVRHRDTNTANCTRENLVPVYRTTPTASSSPTISSEPVSH